MLSRSFSTAPLSGVSAPVMICSCVVFPAPLTPAQGAIASKQMHEMGDAEGQACKPAGSLAARPDASKRVMLTHCVYNQRMP